MIRSAYLTSDVRIYGANAQEIALRFRDRETRICPTLGIVVWQANLKTRKTVK